MDTKVLNIKEKEQLCAAPDFWDDPKLAQRKLKELNSLKMWVKDFNDVSNKVDEVEIYFEFLKEGEIETEDLDKAEATAVEAIDALELKNMLPNEEDEMDAIIYIKPGAGGTESQDWAGMLLRMYIMYGEKNGFKVNLLEEKPGDPAGISSATIEVNGPFAYGFLKGERGVHRLVRISPFDSASRRHTSFASVDVTPQIDDTIEIDISPADLEWDTYRSSGKGGQKVNKVETAVRVKHIPTGEVVECQQERTQIRNKDKAMKMLKSRLYQLELEKRQAAKNAVEADKLAIEWGSQIRNYVFHPYKLVKDVRTSTETSNVGAVMDGEIGDFIKSYLMAISGANAQDK